MDKLKKKKCKAVNLGAPMIEIDKGDVIMADKAKEEFVVVAEATEDKPISHNKEATEKETETEDKTVDTETAATTKTTDPKAETSNTETET